MPFTMKCITPGCTTIVVYKDPQELLPHFYKKGDYFLKKCKKCVLKEYAERYANSNFNHRKKELREDPNRYAFGTVEGRG